MERSAISRLVNWKQDPYRKPLLVRGARQVGKTFLIEEFGRQHFPKSFIKFDFEARPELKRVFAESLEPAEIVPRLEVFANRSIADHESLLFFDEIQACPQALTALRYFYEQRPHLPVIAAGSLLEFAVEKVSFPVGRVQNLNIYPMSFTEFLAACGKTKLVELITAAPKALSPAEHDLALQEFRKFLIVGGLPEAVRIFAETGSLIRALEVQRDLVLMYENDFSKYGKRVNLDCLRQVFRGAAQRITQPLQYAHLSADFSGPTIKNAVNLLSMAQVIHKVPHTHPQGLPLGAGISQKQFKIILLDLGLLHALSKLSPVIEIEHADLLDAYRGALAEQAVGQSLLEQCGGDLYTWYRPVAGSQAKVDFLIERNGSVIPIEVKSGAPGRLKSMHVFLKETPLAKFGIVISTAPYAELKADRLKLLPIYYLEKISGS